MVRYHQNLFERHDQETLPANSAAINPEAAMFRLYELDDGFRIGVMDRTTGRTLLVVNNKRPLESSESDMKPDVKKGKKENCDEVPPTQETPSLGDVGDTPRRLRSRNRVQYNEDKAFQAILSVAPTPAPTPTQATAAAAAAAATNNNKIDENSNNRNPVNPRDNITSSETNHMIVVFKEDPDSEVSPRPQRTRLLPASAYHKLSKLSIKQKKLHEKELQQQKEESDVTLDMTPDGEGRPVSSSSHDLNPSQSGVRNASSSSTGSANHEESLDLMSPSKLEYMKLLNLIDQPTYGRDNLQILNRCWHLRIHSRTQPEVPMVVLKPAINKGNKDKRCKGSQAPHELVNHQEKQMEHKRLWLDQIRHNEPFIQNVTLRQKTPQFFLKQHSDGTFAVDQTVLPTAGNVRRQRLSTCSYAGPDKVSQASSDFVVNLIRFPSEWTATQRELMVQFNHQFLVDPMEQSRNPLELGSPLGKRIIDKCKDFVTVKSYGEIENRRKMIENFCGTSPNLFRMIQTSAKKHPVTKVEFSLTAPCKSSCVTQRYLRSLQIMNPYSMCWGLKSYHIYTFNEQERLEKDLTLRTGMDWKKRLMSLRDLQVVSSKDSPPFTSTTSSPLYPEEEGILSSSSRHAPSIRTSNANISKNSMSSVPATAFSPFHKEVKVDRMGLSHRKTSSPAVAHAASIPSCRPPVSHMLPRDQQPIPRAHNVNLNHPRSSPLTPHQQMMMMMMEGVGGGVPPINTPNPRKHTYIETVPMNSSSPHKRMMLVQGNKAPHRRPPPPLPPAPPAIPPSPSTNLMTNSTATSLAAMVQALAGNRNLNFNDFLQNQFPIPPQNLPSLAAATAAANMALKMRQMSEISPFFPQSGSGPTTDTSMHSSHEDINHHQYNQPGIFAPRQKITSHQLQQQFHRHQQQQQQQQQQHHHQHHQQQRQQERHQQHQLNRHHSLQHQQLQQNHQNHHRHQPHHHVAQPDLGMQPMNLSSGSKQRSSISSTSSMPSSFTLPPSKAPSSSHSLSSSRSSLNPQQSTSELASAIRTIQNTINVNRNQSLANLAKLTSLSFPPSTSTSHASSSSITTPSNLGLNPFMAQMNSHPQPMMGMDMDEDDGEEEEIVLIGHNAHSVNPQSSSLSPCDEFVIDI